MDAGHARELLAGEQVRLEQARVDGAGGAAGESDPSPGFDQHPADLGTDTFEREKDQSILEGIEAELADVEHALGRINDGTYGVCEACGRPIDEERLEAMPAARFCVHDQAAAERQARGPSTS